MGSRGIPLWAWVASIVLMAVGGLAGTGASAETRSAGQGLDGPSHSSSVVARVAGTEITRQELEQMVAQEIRSRFYHGRPPAAQTDALQQEVLEALIERKLLLEAARQRHLRPDEEAVQARLDAIEKRYADKPQWAARRDVILDSLRQRLREDNVLRQLRDRVQAVAPPTESQLQAYYRAHPEKFTEPARSRVSLILLRVDPSAPKSAWDAAMHKAQELRRALEDGAAFDALARRYSDDRTAAQGGDMGYLHEGMLGSKAAEVIGSLSVGEVSQPVRLLEGVALFRLEERTPARLRSFGDVRQRVGELWLREQAQKAWKSFVQGLRAKAVVEIYESPVTDRKDRKGI